MPSSPRRCLLIKRLPLRLALSATLSGDFPQAQQLYINILVVNYGSKPFLLMNNNTEKGKGIKLRSISYSHIISIIYYIYIIHFYLPFIFIKKKKEEKKKKIYRRSSSSLSNDTIIYIVHLYLKVCHPTCTI